MQCKNHLKQVGVAMHSYESSFGCLPYGCAYDMSLGIPSAHPPLGGTWAAFILPQLDNQVIFDMFDWDYPVWHDRNKAAVQIPIDTYICPSDPAAVDPLQGGKIHAGSANPGKSMGLWYPASMGPTQDGRHANSSCVFCPGGLGTYCCVSGVSFGWDGQYVGMFGRHATGIKFEDVTDGLSHTFMVGESLPTQCNYLGAYHHNFNVAGTAIPLGTMESSTPGVDDKWYLACGFKSMHGGGAHFCMGDGSVHFVSDAIDYRLYNLLGNRSDGETAWIPN